MSTDRHAIAIVGAGPRGAGLLERLAASVPELLPGGPLLDVHLIDPYPAGAGRIWRHDQSPLLAMNSMAADVTMYTDESVRCDGPVRPGPSFWDWAQDLREGAGRRGPRRARPGAGRRAARGHRLDVPQPAAAERLPGRVLRDVIAGLPAGMRVHVHRAAATGLTEDGDAPARAPRRRSALRVDAVVLASGHLDATPTEDELELAARAAAAGLRYLPPGADHRHRPVGARAGGDGDRPRAWGWRSSTSSCCSSRGAAAASSRTPDRRGSCATSRPEPSRGWSSGRRAGRPTTPRRTTSCAPAARRCPGSSAPAASIR